MDALLLTMALCTSLNFTGISPLNQPPQAIKEVELTAKSVGQRLVLDLSSGGSIYSVGPAIDSKRIFVRTPKGEQALAALIKSSGKPAQGTVHIGTPKDFLVRKLAMQRLPGRAGSTQFSCGAMMCVCTGDRDCDNLFRGTQCGPVAMCDQNGCWCVRA